MTTAIGSNHCFCRRVTRFLGAWRRHREIYGDTLRAELVYELKKALDHDPDLEMEPAFTHVLADEYQDLNRCELAVLEGLVGDGRTLLSPATTTRASTVFGVPLQRTTAATESIYVLVRNAFDDLGYRRVEWKCKALNAASRRAAALFGLTFEGVFHKHTVVKGRNRDTA